MTHDVIVVGGSYAGMAAALQLLRARRDVLILDAGQRRNRFAAHSHGFLTRDGEPPEAIAATARAQLEAYPTLTWIDTAATGVSGAKDAFTVTTSDGTHEGRRLLLATGVTDTLPDIPGLADRWGRTIAHCPYCHGYELNRGRIGVIATGPSSLHQAQLLPEWGETTFFLNRAFTPDDAQRADLAARGVAIEDTPIARITGDATVDLADGRSFDMAGLFTAPAIRPTGTLHETLGCDLTDTPLGPIIATHGAKETSVPGVFACGDAGTPMHSVAMAVGDGTFAGAGLHRSLLFPEA